MITQLLLPFFLVSRVSVDLDSWYYGPEYTFNVGVVLSHVKDVSTRANDVTRAFYVSSILKCRPRVPDTLTCRFASTGMIASEEGLADLGEDIVENWEIDEEPFEVKFDRYGVYSLVVTGNISVWKLDVIRSIVNQLNFGVDMRKRSEGEFASMERSYIGECEATIKVTRKPSNESSAWKDGFEILPMAGFSKAPGEVIEIRKTRNLAACTHKENYFFGSDQMRRSGLPDAGAEPVITSSETNIHISDREFSSDTNNEVTVHSSRRNKDIRLYERIILWLGSVSPAKVDFPTVPNPVMAAFYLHRELNSRIDQIAM